MKDVLADIRLEFEQTAEAAMQAARNTVVDGAEDDGDAALERLHCEPDDDQPAWRRSA